MNTQPGIEKTPTEILLEKLIAPFPVSDINWKAQVTSQDKTRALAVAYIDVRDVVRRLDQVVGAFNWSVDHKMVGDTTISGIGIRDPQTNAWIWKWDAGFVEEHEGQNDSRMKSVKGTISDGIKRAAVLWGIGRYLYQLPKTWVGYNAQEKKLTETPALPAWATPEGYAGRANGTKSVPQPAPQPAAQTASSILRFPDGTPVPETAVEAFNKYVAANGAQPLDIKILRTWAKNTR